MVRPCGPVARPGRRPRPPPSFRPVRGSPPPGSPQPCPQPLPRQPARRRHVTAPGGAASHVTRWATKSWAPPPPQLPRSRCLSGPPRAMRLRYLSGTLFFPEPERGSSEAGMQRSGSLNRELGFLTLGQSSKDRHGHPCWAPGSVHE
nr:proline-rich protein 2-like [Cavia porcellus]